jgi:P-type conjugative transfer protein TrbJ
MNMKRMLAAVGASLLPLHVAAPPAHALFGVGDVVYDPANHVENILTAARALEEIGNQIRQLQNEAAMLVNQARNLEGLSVTAAPELQAAVVRIRSLIDRAEGIAFEIAATEEAWARDYPESYAALGHDEMVANARLQWTNARDALGTALAMQAEVVTLAEGDADTLARLLAESSGASGNLDATQATNELIGLNVAQGLRTQQLLAAQTRAEALDRARALEEAEAARVRRERFLGDGAAYVPES